jgi:hypothetical protein
MCTSTVLFAAAVPAQPEISRTLSTGSVVSMWRSWLVPCAQPAGPATVRVYVASWVVAGPVPEIRTG